MDSNEKVMNFLTVIVNAYRSEDNQETPQQMTLDDENITEDFTALTYSLHIFFNKVTGQDIDAIEFTHLMNKLVFQHLMEQALKESEENA